MVALLVSAITRLLAFGQWDLDSLNHIRDIRSCDIAATPPAAV